MPCKMLLKIQVPRSHLQQLSIYLPGIYLLIISSSLCIFSSLPRWLQTQCWEPLSQVNIAESWVSGQAGRTLSQANMDLLKQNAGRRTIISILYRNHPLDKGLNYLCQTNIHSKSGHLTKPGSAHSRVQLINARTREMSVLKGLSRCWSQLYLKLWDP